MVFWSSLASSDSLLVGSSINKTSSSSSSLELSLSHCLARRVNQIIQAYNTKLWFTYINSPQLTLENMTLFSNTGQIAFPVDEKPVICRPLTIESKSMKQGSKHQGNLLNYSTFPLVKNIP